MNDKKHVWQVMQLFRKLFYNISKQLSSNLYFYKCDFCSFSFFFNIYIFGVFLLIIIKSLGILLMDSSFMRHWSARNFLYLVKSDSQVSIFNFSVFVSSLAILVIVFTITDVRYHFRIAIARFPFFKRFSLFKSTYYIILIIGLGTLSADVWFANNWQIPYFLSNKSYLEGALGLLFLSIALVWIWNGFLSPPIFNKKNFKKYFEELRKIIMKGSDNELPIIADELKKSANSIVFYSKNKLWVHGHNDKNSIKKYIPEAGDFAHDLLLLIANRKLCRHIITSSPGTAIKFFNEISKSKKYEIPIGQFSVNIATEAIINKDSPLYHEDEGYSADWIGYSKPFSNAIYSNYELVESLASNQKSPLDIPFEIRRSWDAQQLEVYARVTLITLKSYIKTGFWGQHSFTLYRALGNIKESCQDLYKLNNCPSDVTSTEVFKKLQVSVNFIEDAVKFIDESLPSDKAILREDKPNEQNFYDHMAKCMLDLILYGASINSSPEMCWTIQHNIIMSAFFQPFKLNKTWTIIQYRLRRLLYDEIMQLEKAPKYKSAKILGFCLNIMGLKLREKKGYGRSYYSLHKIILEWVRLNYISLWQTYPKISKECLVGNINFDEKGKRLVKTYAEGINAQAPQEYLDLI